MIIVLIGWPLFFLIVGAITTFVGACSVIYGVQSTFKNEIPWLKPFTPKQKWGLFALLVGILSSIASFVYGFVESDGFFGTVGLLVWIVLSLVAAYLCSPMRMSLTGEDAPIKGGRGPFSTMMRLTSLLLIMAFSWIFVLLAIFRKATWKLFVGIILFVLLAIFVGLSILANQVGGWKKLFEKPLTAEEQLEIDLSTKYADGLLAIDEADYNKAITIFKELMRDHDYMDAEEQYLKAHYLYAKAFEAANDYRAAANHYDNAGDYVDAKVSYYRVCYLFGCDFIDSRKYTDAIEWLTKSNGYENSSSLITYCEAVELAKDDLLTAEAKLLTIDASIRDVSTMLTAIDTYRAWCKSYVLESKSGDKLEEYTKATLILTYTQPVIGESTLQWVVRLERTAGASSYKAKDEMPSDGSLNFTYGTLDYSWKVFEITEDTLKVSMFETDSKYGWEFASHYVFVAE